MAIVESAYSSLLQGVSQQEDTAKREGQLKEQINMWSDPTYGLRRRGGVATRTVLNVQTENNKLIITEFENSAGTFYILWNLRNATAYVFDSNWTLKDTQVVSYLSTAQTVIDIGTASVGNTGFILNRRVKPVPTNTSTLHNPVYDGFILIRTGAFTRSYAVNITVAGIGSFDFSYTTDSTAANSTPEAIATQFKTQMDANTTFISNFDVTRDGATLFLTRSVKSPSNINTTAVTSNNGSTYVLTSAGMNVPQASDLPAKLPTAADKTVLSVGTSLLARTYYYWNAANASWIECAQYGSYDKITNMPQPYKVDTTGLLVLESTTYPLRISGDDNNNPYHNFVSNDITGICSYQGRLVILSGAYASTSSSLDYTKLMRTTVTSLVSTDGFEVSSSRAAGASFKYGIQFNKDLVVLGDKHQAVIPSGNTAITPTNAMMVPTGNANLGLTCAPASTPRTVVVPNSNTKFIRLGEVVPSTLVDSQYTYQEVTDHIPTYMEGTAVAITESSTNCHVVVLGNTQTTKLLSHEYYWDGDQRKLMSFSTWEFGLPIAGIHYTRDSLVVVASSNGNTIIATLDGKTPFVDGGNYYLDFYKPVAATGRNITVPTELVPVGSQLALASAEQAIYGEPVGIESYTAGTIQVVRSFANASAVVGLPFKSSMSPTSPVLKDSKEVALTDSKMVLKKYLVAVRKTGEFEIEVKSNLDEISSYGEPVLWRSTELGFDKPIAVATGDVSIPIGIPVEQASVTISTSSTRELNIKDIQYTLKVEIRPQRRRL